jgi:transcription-repair coupling factor (superfamily II helicase)
MPTTPQSTPVSAIALRLAEVAQTSGRLIYIARSESRAAELYEAFTSLFKGVAAVLLPPWDCLPYDRASPSKEAMGARLSAARRLSALNGHAFVLISTPDAAMQRLPPRASLGFVHCLSRGQRLDAPKLESDLIRAGYVADERVDEPGEIAFRSQVLEIFPSSKLRPYRIDIEDGHIEGIRVFDAATQRTVAEVEDLLIEPASEIAILAPEDRAPGLEHWLPSFYPRLETLFDVAPHASVVLEPGAEARAEAFLTIVKEGYQDRLRFHNAERSNGRSPLEPQALYLASDEFFQAVAGKRAELDLSEIEDPPAFALEKSPLRFLTGFLKKQKAKGARALLVAEAESDLKRMESAALRAGFGGVQTVASLEEAHEAGSVLALLGPVRKGCIDLRENLAIAAAGDIFGTRANRPGDKASAFNPLSAEEEFDLDDVVVHLDHGVALLRDLEKIETAEATKEALRLEYAKAETLLAPVDEIGKVWRYGSAANEVKLDRLKGRAWEKRRAKVAQEIEETARVLAKLAKTRKASAAPALIPPQPEFETFAARFPYALTPDQTRAIDDVLVDLSAGHPMDRLIVGDVGFGKTEVALRAAAAALLAGKQTAIVAPTTVLVRQHLETFAKRFGFEPGHLSRLASRSEANRVKDGLRSGEVRLVIGTHALAAKDVAFADLGLVVIDEEHRFGVRDKEKLQSLSKGVHVLTLTATPIPRTLQSAVVGLRDLSVIATPPARRRPVRTFLMQPDLPTLRQALLREKRRGGQSFVVTPRIADIEDVLSVLGEVAPQLDISVAHGKLAASRVDEVMISFANGKGDILLATNIIEAGLDVAAANTMIVFRAEQFGLAQLHQLRGRVGRGRAQGFCYLLSESLDKEGNDGAAKRLSHLASLDRLGAGLALSMRDLDTRGAGSLFGGEQAGHVKLLGAGLYQDMLERALNARGHELDSDWTPELKFEDLCALPPNYIPEPQLRINAYSRFARAENGDKIDDLLEEMEDRFGPLPPEVERLSLVSRLRLACRQIGIARIEDGPKGLAFTVRDDIDTAGIAASLADFPEAEVNGRQIVLRRAVPAGPERLKLAEAFLSDVWS